MEREQITIRLPMELKKRIQKQADKKGFSFNGTVINLLEKGLAATK